MENEIAKPVTLFNTPKGVLLYILAVCVSGPIAMIFPYIFHGTYASCVFGAISFFAVPFICFWFIKKMCTRNATFVVNKLGFEVQEIDEENNTTINWDEIASYQVRPFKALSGKGFVVKIHCKSDRNFKFEIIDSWNLYDAVDEESIVVLISQHISKYNGQQTNEENKIVLLPGFFASKSGIYLFWLPILLVVFDLAYRLTHPMVLKKDVLFFFSVAMLALGLFGQRKKSKQVFERLSEVQ
ncbi:MAG: hypothetical protein V5804_07405 [Mucilaginibacter sp.]|uniref:hypothetical protein n=1 Tax=Mucilaginibacter sp. TaxID=1882438 RepID=UPI0034E4F3A5